MTSRNQWQLGVLAMTLWAAAGSFTIAATWNGGTSNWNVAGNWTPADVPDVAGDTAEISAGGTYIVTLDIDPTIDSLTINAAGATLFANDRTLTTDGPFNITSGSAEFRRSDINGSGTLTNDGTLTLVSTAADHTFINSGFANNGTMIVRGVNSGNHTTVETADGFTNTGLLQLATHIGWQGNLIVNGTGNLVNTSTGTLRSQNISDATATSLSANVANSGAVEVIDSISFNKAGAVFSNDVVGATFEIAAGKSATFTTATFTQTDGSTTVNTGATMTGLTTYMLDGGTLAVDGMLTATNFEQNGGTISGSGTITANGGNVDLNTGSSSGVTFGASSNLAGSPAELNIAGGYTYDANSNLAGYVDITGPFTVNAGRTFTARGFSNGGNTKTVNAPAFTNDGTVILEGEGNGWNMTLAVPTGTLTNSTTGVINMTDGIGFSSNRTLAAEIDNQGALNISTDLTTPSIGRAGADHTNSGAINVSDNASITGDSFTQTGGNITLLDGSVLTISTTSQAFPGGAIEGNGTLTSDVNATGAGSGLTLGPGLSTGQLNVTGSVLLNGNDSVAIELGGTSQGAVTGGYDFLNVSGSIDLNGSSLILNLVNGFTPDNSDIFQIVAGGSVLGTFGNASSSIFADNYLYTVTYDANSVTLSNATFVPEPSTAVLLALGLLALRGRRRSSRRTSRCSRSG